MKSIGSSSLQSHMNRKAPGFFCSVEGYWGFGSAPETQTDHSVVFAALEDVLRSTIPGDILWEDLMEVRSNYGMELVLDLHECDRNRFSRDHIDLFLTELCNLIGMVRCDVHFWDDVGVDPEKRQTLPHTKGTSAVCFILTSSIVLHALDILGSVYLNIFSCKAFDVKAVENFARERFDGRVVNSQVIDRF